MDAVDAGDVRLEDAERLGEAAQQELEQVRAELAASKEKYDAQVAELNASLEKEKGQREAAAHAAQEATEELATAKSDSCENKDALAALQKEHDAKVAELNAMLDNEKRQREALLREAEDAARMAQGIVLVQRARARATTREGTERVNELEKELELAERALVDCEEAKRAIEYREGDEWMELQHNIAQLNGKVADLQAELTACAESAKSPGTVEENQGSPKANSAGDSGSSLVALLKEAVEEARAAPRPIRSGPVRLRASSSCSAMISRCSSRRRLRSRQISSSGWRKRERSLQRRRASSRL